VTMPRLQRQNGPDPGAGREHASGAIAQRRAAQLLRAAPAVALGVLAALLVACSGSSKGLIPVADAGPLQGDFEAVAQAAENGDGACSRTESTLLKTEQDFAALPPSVDSGLRNTIRHGIDNLRTQALALCAQPLPQSTLSTTTPTTTSDTTTTTTPTETQSTPTETQSTPTTSPSGPGGGTPAPGEEGEEEGAGVGKGEGGGKGHDGRAGGTGAESGAGAEAGK
jgi:hypothetical protein